MGPTSPLPPGGGAPSAPTPPPRPLLDREPVAAQDGSGQRGIAVLTLAFAPVTRAIPGVRLGPAEEAAFRPPAMRSEGAEGTAFVRPCARVCHSITSGERTDGGPGQDRRAVEVYSITRATNGPPIS
jgi:hypothetical protein